MNFSNFIFVSRTLRRGRQPDRPVGIHAAGPRKDNVPKGSVQIRGRHAVRQGRPKQGTSAVRFSALPQDKMTQTEQIRLPPLFLRSTMRNFVPIIYSVCYCFESKNANFSYNLRNNRSNVCAKRRRFSLSRLGKRRTFDWQRMRLRLFSSLRMSLSGRLHFSGSSSSLRIGLFQSPAAAQRFV